MDKIELVAWVFRNLVEHAKEGGSFRHLIYTRLGFDADAYGPLYEAGGMVISNEFDIQKMNNIRRIVQLEKTASNELKQALNLCDEPGCYEEASCGFNAENGYRRTCSEHFK